MSISHDLFRNPSTVDKLDLLQSLSDAQDLTSDQALALINIIRSELGRPQTQNASTYRRYSEVTTSLSRQMPEVYEQMAAAWTQRRQAAASAGSPLRALMQGPAKAASATGRKSESDEESDEEAEEAAKGGKESARAESREASEESGEKEEEHEEEEEEEKEEKEDGEKEEAEEAEAEEGKEEEERMGGGEKEE